MNKRLIIIIAIVAILVTVAIAIAVALTSKKEQDIDQPKIPTDEKTTYDAIDPDTGEPYTVNGVHSGETFDEPYVYNTYGLKQAGVTYDQSVEIEKALIKYVVDKYGSKYTAITVLSSSIALENGDTYEFKSRLGDVGSNTYIYTSSTIQKDGSMKTVIKDTAG